MESTPVTKESLIFRSYYVKLVSILAQHLNDVLLHLVSEGVIKIEEKNTIKNYRDTPNERAEYLLDNYVNRQLSEGITDNFMKLLKVMLEIPGCYQLAVELSMASKYADTGPSTPVVSNARLSGETSNVQTGKDIQNRIKVKFTCITKIKTGNSWMYVSRVLWHLMCTIFVYSQNFD